MTGTEGWVTYSGQGHDSARIFFVFLQIYWDNPYISEIFSSGPGNNATAILSGQQNSRYKARYGIGAGNAAQFVFRLYEKDQINGGQIAPL